MDIEAVVVNVRKELFYIPDRLKSEYEEARKIRYPNNEPVEYRWLKMFAKSHSLSLPLSELRDD